MSIIQTCNYCFMHLSFKSDRIKNELEMKNTFILYFKFIYVITADFKIYFLMKWTHLLSNN